MTYAEILNAAQDQATEQAVSWIVEQAIAPLTLENQSLTAENALLRTTTTQLNEQVLTQQDTISDLTQKLYDCQNPKPPILLRDVTKQPFTSTSYMNIPIGTGAIYEKPTDTKTKAIRSFGSGTVNSVRWSYPRYFANANTQKIKLTEVEYIGGPATGNSWTIELDASAEPGGGDDKPILAWQSDQRYVFEIYKATWNSDRTAMTSSSVRKVDTFSDAYVPGAQAAQIPAQGGLITPEELATGDINHSLMVAFPNALLKSGFIYPARGQDSNHATAYAGPCPMGTFLAIPTATEIASLGLATQQGEGVARALQERGGYVKLRASTICLFVQANGADPALVKGLIPDWVKIIQALVVVTNSTKENPGGPGDRIASLVAPLPSEVAAAAGT